MLIWKNTSALEGFEDSINFTEQKDFAEIAVIGSKPIAIEEFPNLKVIFHKPHTHIQYLCSGGMNFRQLVPSFFNNALKTSEWLLSCFNSSIALCHTIVIKKVT